MDGLRARRHLKVLVLVLVLSFLAVPVAAHHGTFHAHQHTWDTSSTVFVKAHSSCSQNCNKIWSDIKKSGVWYGGSCISSNDACSFVYSPEKAYSFPVTVQTDHTWQNSIFDGEGVPKSVYYP